MSLVFDTLSPFVSEERLARMRDVLTRRTRNLVLVVEDLYDPHNMSAVVRTAEAHGVQELHVVEHRTRFAPHKKITLGAHNWMDIQRYGAPEDCLTHLRDRGFQVVTGALTPRSIPIHAIDFARPTAMVFGNEHDGLTSAFLDRADQVFQIPMHGFSQSLNISVSAAIATFFAVNERIRLLGRSGDLSPEDQAQILDAWLKRSVPMSDRILAKAQG
jgi:tRNA (guanosine-2'-O-)-methyltransferase